MTVGIVFIKLRAPAVVNRLIQEAGSHVDKTKESTHSPTSTVGPTKKIKNQMQGESYLFLRPWSWLYCRRCRRTRPNTARFAG
jgi:hypothetical protein